MDVGDYYALISGERRGWNATLVRSVLSAIEIPYAAAVSWRNRGFDSGRFRTHAVKVPVISVGNLTLGGTGKTPMVAWLAQWLQNQHLQVTIVSRGYGGGRDGWNDEALELQRTLPGVPHVQNRDRVLGARQAIEEHHAQVIILDDGFQHRRIARDLDIVLIDGLSPFGFDHVFPRGALREPCSGLARAHVIALSRADAVDEDTRDAIRQRAQAMAPQGLWLETAHQPIGWLMADQQSVALSQLQNANVAAFCGIGNPQGFRHSLTRAGVQIAAFREFPDHHPYSDQDMRSLDQWVEGLPQHVDSVVCTHKDLVKLPSQKIAGKPLHALQIGLEVTQGEKSFTARLQHELALWMEAHHGATTSESTCRNWPKSA